MERKTVRHSAARSRAQPNVDMPVWVSGASTGRAKDGKKDSEAQRGEEPCAAERGYARLGERSEHRQGLKKVWDPALIGYVMKGGLGSEIAHGWK